MTTSSATPFAPPAWLPSRAPWGGHAQTLWSAVFTRHGTPAPQFRRERWTTPDGDFVDADWHEPLGADGTPLAPDAVDSTTPLLVLFHGLEGSSASHYAQAFAQASRERGWRFVMPHFRGCSGSINLAPRAYHCGDFEEVGWMLARCRAAHAGPVHAAGVSLGGNALLRWAQEAGGLAARAVRSVCAVSAPLDLLASGRAMGVGFNRWVYTQVFLRSLKPKALSVLRQHPGLFSLDTLNAVRDLQDFDNLFTAPLHGFVDAEDYWRRAAAKPHLRRLQLPTLLLNARNDPFMPEACLPNPDDVRPEVSLWQPVHGGHAGFVTGAWPGTLKHLPEAVLDWMHTHG
ncbi:MAG: alpha/beta fold hydrolase [Pseudomonadota bacterium]